MDDICLSPHGETQLSVFVVLGAWPAISPPSESDLNVCAWFSQSYDTRTQLFEMAALGVNAFHCIHFHSKEREVYSSLLERRHE